MKIKYLPAFRLFLLLTVIATASVLVVSSFSKDPKKADCSETIKIDGVEYSVPERWCGKKLGKPELANSKNLSKIPADISFEGSKIYVTSETKKALVSMAESAGKSGIVLIVDSGFRSIWYQKQIIQKRLQSGEKYEKMINFVAPPGYSEHHTARAVDFVPSEARFAHTTAYQWLRENAREFGFYETYPEDTTGTTPWESWHWVYQSK